MQVQTNIGDVVVTLSLEAWHCNDVRFPLTKDIKAPYPGPNELTSLRNNGFQLQAVLVVKVTEGDTDYWHFIFGNRRLLKIREYFDAQEHNGTVLVMIAEGVDPNDRATLSMIENQQRTPNRINDFGALMELRKINPMITYQEVAKLTGITVGALKALDSDYKAIPVWALTAMVKGDITEGTAKELGKIKNPDVLKELKAEYKTEGTLSKAHVQEKRTFVQQQAYAPVANQLFSAPVAVKKSFVSRKELLTAIEGFESEADKQIILQLLS